MMTSTPIDQKTKLEKAVKAALITAKNEMNVLKQHYTEENFRYVVMTKISKEECFGVFPNKKKDGYLLCFEKKYEKNTFYPDIVSVKLRSNGKNDRINKNNPLVIELKINAEINAPEKKEITSTKYPDEIQKIKKMGSCISTDLHKVRQYLKRVDDIQFKHGVVMNIGIPKAKKKEPTKQDFHEYTMSLQKVLNEHQKEFSREKNSSKNLLFAWFNPLINKPELVWLGKKKLIKLEGLK